MLSFNKLFKAVMIVCAVALLCGAPGVAQARPLPANAMALVGSNFSVSQNPDTTYSSVAAPAMAYNTASNEFLVVWSGLESGMEYEIYGQRLNASGTEIPNSTDFRISTNTTSSEAYSGDVAVAYNSVDDEYLVVWYGDSDTMYDNDIYGQRVDGNGTLLGTNFRISDMSYPDWGAVTPALAYNPTNNEYLVVWAGLDALGGENNYEIYGQRLSGAGAELGTNDFRISDMGLDAESVAIREAFTPSVAFDTVNNRYLVVWAGDDLDAGSAANTEIYGQLIGSTGTEVAPNDFQISSMGSTAEDGFVAKTPDVVYNAYNPEFLVVWSGEGTGTDDEFEIYGQRLNTSGTEIPDSTDFRISDMGTDGNSNFDAYSPAVDFNASNRFYLVTWSGNDNTAPLMDNEYEIFGQYLNRLGGEYGTNDFRISTMGVDGSSAYQGDTPDAVFNKTTNEAMFVWSGDHTAPGDNDGEIFGQLDDALPTAVTVSGFSSELDPQGIRLVWNSFGGGIFNLYRSAPGQPETLINPIVISGTGPDFVYFDTTVEAGVTYTYWLEAVDAQGNTTRVGPMEASLGSRIFLPLTRR